jgi:hypothetical protein
MADQKTCFVVMGFGVKTDFATGRKLDLNKSYRLLIKPVVEAKGLTCLRADEMLYSGTIDMQMYLELLNADVVVADISTANPNALYELGLRHALKPRTTIVISESQMTYPFDLNHIKITSYTHLGDAIDYEEVERFRKVLSDTIEDVLTNTQTDSPVYTFLQLEPPSLRAQINQAVAEKTKEMEADAPPESQQTLSVITQQAEDAVERNDFITAQALFNSALLIWKPEGNNSKSGANTYLTHRLAFVTYKSKFPDELTSLNKALDLLKGLDLQHTNDTETVSLAGAIEKRLFESGQGEAHLAAGLEYYQRSYFLLHNRYHGVNLALMTDYRSLSSFCTTEEDRIADKVIAKRIRLEVLVMCDKDWDNIMNKQSSVTIKDGLARNDAFIVKQQKSDKEQMFWILTNRAEAYFGLDDMDGYNKALSDAQNAGHESEMMDALTEQINKLKIIKQQQAVKMASV